VNISEPEQALSVARLRVLGIQAKLHRWATDDSHRRFDDLFNLVTDPAFLLVAWDRVRTNRGAKTPGVDGRTAASIAMWTGVDEFLAGLRASLKDRSFRPLPVRERMIPKANGKLRRLGIATIANRVVQASLKLVLEPIFEADFYPCSYGFRPMRRAHDAVAEVRYLASRTRDYEWVVEGDIKACFDEISHVALMERVRARVGDKRVLDLVKAFLKAGILTEDRMLRKTDAGSPQGSLCSAEHNPPCGVPIVRSVMVPSGSCSGFKPPLHVQQYPRLPGMVLHRPENQAPGNGVEERPDIHIDNPVVLPAPPASLCHRMQRRPPRAVPVGIRVEYRLCCRFQHHADNCLRYPVGHRRNP